LADGKRTGAHAWCLALLAAYAPQHRDLTPPGLAETDLSVRGVVSMFSQVDREATYHHTGQQALHADDPRPDWDAPPSPWAKRPFGQDAERLGLDQMVVDCRLDWLLGGTHPTKCRRRMPGTPRTSTRADARTRRGGVCAGMPSTAGSPQV
jgi:hypothetical protein